MLSCATSDGDELDLICKLSDGCDEGVTSLFREAISAWLALELELPIPTPYFIDIPSTLVTTDCNERIAERIDKSSHIAFGSLKVPNQFETWTPGHRVSATLKPKALAAFVFDAIIQNPDRTSRNPNCLVSGSQIYLIDHELAFTHESVIGWNPPWEMGSLDHLVQDSNKHIFLRDLAGKKLDFAPIIDSWSRLKEAELKAIWTSLPHEWNIARSKFDSAISLVIESIANITNCIDEIKRILQ